MKIPRFLTSFLKSYILKTTHTETKMINNTKAVKYIMSEEKEISGTKVTDCVSTLRIAICDDETEDVDSLKQILMHSRGEQKIEIETYLSSKKFLQVLEEKDKESLPDIVFLDIEMPEIDGIFIAKKIRNLPADIYIVFITVHPEYAINGYETRAFRYVLKPLSENTITSILLDITRELSKKKRLIIKNNRSEYLIPLDEIVFICAEDKYTILYTKSHHYIDRLTLKNYEDLLSPYGFYRVHRKYIVNLLHHIGMEKGHICLTGNVRIPISRRKENEYHKELLQNLERNLI